MLLRVAPYSCRPRWATGVTTTHPRQLPHRGQKRRRASSIQRGWRHTGKARACDGPRCAGVGKGLVVDAAAATRLSNIFRRSPSVNLAYTAVIVSAVAHPPCVCMTSSGRPQETFNQCAPPFRKECVPTPVSRKGCATDFLKES